MQDGQPIKPISFVIDKARCYASMKFWRVPRTSQDDGQILSTLGAGEWVIASPRAWLGDGVVVREADSTGGREVLLGEGGVVFDESQKIIQDVRRVTKDGELHGVAILFYDADELALLAELEGQPIAVGLGDAVVMAPVELRVSENVLLLTGHLSQKEASQMWILLDGQSLPVRVDLPPVSVTYE